MYVYTIYVLYIYYIYCILYIYMYIMHMQSYLVLLASIWFWIVLFHGLRRTHWGWTDEDFYYWSVRTQAKKTDVIHSSNNTTAGFVNWVNQIINQSINQSINHYWGLNCFYFYFKNASVLHFVCDDVTSGVSRSRGAVPVAPFSCQSPHDVMDPEGFRCRKAGPPCSSGSDRQVSQVSTEQLVLTSGTRTLSFKIKAWREHQLFNRLNVIIYSYFSLLFMILFNRASLTCSLNLERKLLFEINWSENFTDMLQFKEQTINSL